MASHWTASPCVRQANEPLEDHLLTCSTLAAGIHNGDCRSTIRGGGNRLLTWHQMPTERMGPPPGASPPMRMTASWSGSKRACRIQVCLWCEAAPQMASSPRINTSVVRRRSFNRTSPCHHRSACSGVKALRNTSDARRQAAKLCYRFGPLTPSARSANLIAGDGTKNGFPAPNKEPSTFQNDT